jgi:GTP-binding protein Era
MHTEVKKTDNFKSGFVAIIGKPNVGKSTLMNKLLHEKISIVTPKPQTTRHQIKGIFTDDKKQIIFLDTPGFLKPRYKLQEKMMEYISHSLKDCDVIVFICDAASFPTDYDHQLLNIIEQVKKPKMALINKIDLVEEETAKQHIEKLNDIDFDEIKAISASEMNDFDFLIDKLTDFLPYAHPFYSEDELSDLPMRFFVQEIIREQIFLKLYEEVPYCSTVVVEEYKEKDNRIDIEANIWVEKKSQKPILLGSKGKMIKAIRESSERELYRIIGKKAYLHLWIKIKPNWRKKDGSLHEFGYR